MRSWQLRLRKYIIHAVERPFVVGVFTPSASLEIMKKCPFCKANRKGITAEEAVEQLMKRVEANDALAMFVLGNYYYHGNGGLLQDQEKAK